MIAYSEVCSFTNTPSQGNRAGVVLKADQLSESKMQDLADFIGVSETVFVTNMQRGVVEVRFFTPTQEVAFCGHATIALGLLLAQAGYWHGGLLELSTLAGRIPLRLEQQNGVPQRIWFRQNNYQERPLPSIFNQQQLRQRLAKALGTNAHLLHSSLPLTRCSIGLWGLMVPLQDSLVLDSLQPNSEQIASLSKELQVAGIYAYAPIGVNRFAARDFSPLVGIDEDPVTGSAGGALIGMLAGAGLLPVQAERASGVIYQGHALDAAGEIEVSVELQGEKVQAIEVGGCAVIERQGVWHMAESSHSSNQSNT